MVGLIAFANDSGLGIQTKRLYDMLKPDKVMVVDSSPFSKNKKQHFNWYKNPTITKGFPKNHEINEWLDGLTSVLTVENPYNFYLIKTCKERGIKTVCQTNYEFCENVFAPWLPVPDLFIMPSYWMVKEMRELFGKERVTYMPPPINPDEFEENRYYHSSRKPRFLHIVGTLAFEDRNGTLDLLEAVKRTKSDFELVIHSQHKLPKEYQTGKGKVKYRIRNYDNNSELYRGFDGLILPRRYGGLSLTTNEALMSGIPVMMPDISPNNKLLPKQWLFPAKKEKTIKVRADIDWYMSDIDAMANMIDCWVENLPSRVLAYKIAVDNFSTKMLKTKYEEILC